MFRIRLNPFFSPDDSATIETGKMSVSDMTEFLGADDGGADDLDDPTLGLEEDKEKGKTDNEAEGEENKEKSLEDEIEEELDEDKKFKDDEEEIDIPRRKEILAKYPQLFKDFPQLERAAYRVQKYSELLPSIADAEIAVEKSKTLDNFSEELQSGNSVTILQSVKEEDPEAFNSLVDNYLGNLRQVDQGAYFHVLGNVLKHTILAMNDSDDGDTKIAAGILNKFIFQTEKFVPPTNLGKQSGPKDDREEALTKREQEFKLNQLNTHVDALNTRVGNVITGFVTKNIDPKESMPEYVKTKALEDCTKALDSQINSDTRFKALLDRLWEKASENNFSQDSLDKIRTAYLSKAKGLLPEIIRKTRITALKGLGHKSPSDERRGPLPVGRPSNGKKEAPARQSSGNSDKDKAKALPKSTKSLDYLMRD